MSLNLNKVILSGRMVADPELKQTPNGKSVATFRIAVNRRTANGEHPEADFFNVTAWQSTADFVEKYFRKGSAICIIGRIQNRTWTDQSGVKKYATDILAEEANFVESRNAEEAPAIPAPAFQSAPPPKFEEVKADEDLPF